MFFVSQLESKTKHHNPFVHLEKIQQNLPLQQICAIILKGKFYESKRRKATGLKQSADCHGSRVAKIYS